MYKKIFGLIFLASSLIFSQAVLADSSYCGEGFKKMISSLNLDASQKEKIKPILDQLKTAMADKASQMDALRKQISQQVQSTSMDQSAVDGLIDQKTKLIGDMMKAKVAAKNQIFNILNDQQKTQMQNMISKMEEKFAEKYKNCHDED